MASAENSLNHSLWAGEYRTALISGSQNDDSSAIDSCAQPPQNTALAMKIHHSLPTDLLELPAHRLHERLNGPSLFLLPGVATRPLFLSVLLHGNEYSGWGVVQRLLRAQGSRLPRSLALLVGNVAAAQHRVRRLDQQPDFNRCWPGAACDNEIARLFQRIHDWAQELNPVANIDIHNNTGNNPLYSIINQRTPENLRLASDFSPLTVYTRYPRGTQSDAFSHFCPSITLECAQPGDMAGEEAALALVQRYLSADAETHLRNSTPAELQLYRMSARVTVPSGVDLTTLPQQGELALAPDLDRYNFRSLPAGTVLGHADMALERCWRAEDAEGMDLTAEYFEVCQGALRTRRELIPGMFTADPVAIQRDCVGYVMEALNH